MPLDFVPLKRQSQVHAGTRAMQTTDGANLRGPCSALQVGSGLALWPSSNRISLLP